MAAFDMEMISRNDRCRMVVIVLLVKCLLGKHQALKNSKCSVHDKKSGMVVYSQLWKAKAGKSLSLTGHPD